LPTRLGFLILILICLYASYATYLDKLPRGVVASIVSGTTFADVLQYLDLVILSGWSFDDDDAPVVVEGQTRYSSGAANAEADGTKKAKAASVKSSASLLSDLYQRLQYGCFISSAPRLIDTKHQVENVPPYKTSNQAYIPSRTSFLLRKALTICVCYLPLDLATSAAKPAENHISCSLDKFRSLAGWETLMVQKSPRNWWKEQAIGRHRIAPCSAIWELGLSCVVRAVVTLNTGDRILGR